MNTPEIGNALRVGSSGLFCAWCGIKVEADNCCGLKNDPVIVELGLANKVWCSREHREEAMMKAIKDAYNAQNR